MKIEGKFIFKVAGTLTAISLVVALLLGLTNMLTADKIAAINKQKTEEALAKVVSSADCEFPEVTDVPQEVIDAANEQGGKLTNVYEILVGGENAGYAFQVTASGSQGNIVMIVGVDADLTVTGVSIVSNSETAGIGYTAVLLILSAFRELLGAGTLLGIQIMPSSYVPANMLTLPVGGFLCLGTLIAIMQWALAKSEKKNAAKKETEGK